MKYFDIELFRNIFVAVFYFVSFIVFLSLVFIAKKIVLDYKPQSNDAPENTLKIHYQ
jgi:hypothetical protein